MTYLEKIKDYLANQTSIDSYSIIIDDSVEVDPKSNIIFLTENGIETIETYGGGVKEDASMLVQIATSNKADIDLIFQMFNPGSHQGCDFARSSTATYNGNSTNGKQLYSFNVSIKNY